MKAYLNQNRQFMNRGADFGGSYGANGVSPQSKSPETSGPGSPRDNEMSEVYNSQLQTTKQFSSLHHKMQLYGDGAGAGLEKPLTTFSIDNQNPNLKMNYIQLPGEKGQKNANAIKAAPPQVAKPNSPHLTNLFKTSTSAARSRSKNHNLSVEIRNKPGLGHLPNTDMRIRATHEMDYYHRMAEKKNKALALLQSFENQKQIQSPRMQELFSKSIIGSRTKVEHSSGDNWWIQKNRNTDSQAQFRTMGGSTQSEIDSPAFTNNFLNSDRIKLKTPNTTYARSTRPDDTIRQDSVFANSITEKRNDELFNSKFSHSKSNHKNQSVNYSDLGSYTARGGDEYLNQTITSFQFQKGKRNSHLYPGQTSLMKTVNPNSQGRKDLLESQLQAKKILRGIRHVTPNQQNVEACKRLRPLPDLTFHVSQSLLNRNTMLLHGIEESQFKNKYKTVYHHLSKTVNGIPTQGQYNRREPKLEKVRVISQHQQQIDKSRFVNIHKHHKVGSFEQELKQSIFDQVKEDISQEAGDSSVMNPKSCASPGRKTTKNETGQSSMDQSPESKFDKILSINVIVDEKSPSIKSPMTSVSNSMRAQTLRMKTVKTETTPKEQEKVSEEYETESEDEERQGVKNTSNYLMNSDPVAMIDQLDKRIEVKKAENEEQYYNKFHENSVLDSLKTKRGKIFIHPCFLKMQIFKYISEAFKTNHRYEIDFNDPVYNQECTHEYAQDHAAEFIENIKQWVIEYEDKIKNSKKDKVDKEFLYDKLYQSIINTKEDEFQILKQNIESSKDLKQFIDQNYLKIQTQHVQEEAPKINSLLESESEKKILIYDQENRMSIPEGVFEMIMSTYENEVREEVERQKKVTVETAAISRAVNSVISNYTQHTNGSEVGDPFFNYAKEKLDKLIFMHQKKLDRRLARRKTKEREIEKHNNKQARLNKNPNTINQPTVELKEKPKTTMEIVKQSLVDNAKKQKAQMTLETSPEVRTKRPDFKVQPTNELFGQMKINQEFYEDSSKLVSNPHSQQTKIRTIYYDQVENNALPQPVYSKIKKNILMLSGEAVSLGQARAIKSFLVENKDDKEFQVMELIVDDCLISDQDLTVVLEGVLAQEKLKSITLSGVGVNEQSCDLLCTAFAIHTVTDSVHTVNFTNIKVQQKHLLKMLESLTEGLKLQHLSMNGLNLGGLVDSMAIINAIHKLIVECFSLCELNLRGCSMSGNEFVVLSQGLKENMTLSNLDLSYLDLSFTLASKQSYVNAFLENITEWIGSSEQSKNLSHLNLSGMGLKQETVIPLVRQIIKHPVLLGVHLSDNHLDGESKNQIMKLFGVDNSFYVKTHGLEEKRFNNADELDLTFEVQKQDIKHGSNQFRFVDDQYSSKHSSRNGVRVQDQARVLNNEIMRNYKESQRINQVKTQSSQRKRFIQSPFIFNRIHGHPELIFNRNKNKKCLIDFSAGDGKWEVQTDEAQCYICNRWCHVSIYFRPDQLNDVYQPIEDPVLIKELRSNYKLDGRTPENKKPIIAGTVTNGIKTCMLQVKHYACLVLQSKLAKQTTLDINNQQQKLNPAFLIRALRKELQLDILNDSSAVDQPKSKQREQRAQVFNDHLVNWRTIIAENLNDKTDQQSVNLPAFNPQQKDEDNIFIYSGFVAPGRHSIIIYFPPTDKFYLKNIIVSHRKAMIDQISKEDTIQISKIGISASRNVFLDWKMPSLDEYQYAIQTNLNRNQNPYLQEVIKRNSIGLVQLHHMLISRSRLYPLCSYQDISALFEMLDIPQSEQLGGPEQEDEFFANQKLTRTEFIDIIIQIYEKRAIAEGYSHSYAILELMNNKILPFLRQQGSHAFRMNTIQTKAINDELYVNMEMIKKLFEKYYNYEQDTFPFSSLKNLFYDFMLPSFGEEMTEKWMSEQRLYSLMAESKMIAIDDEIQKGKYHNINLVELLEFLVRAANSMFTKERLDDVLGEQEGTVTPIIQAQFHTFIEASTQPLHLKVRQLLMMLINSQPKAESKKEEDPFTFVHLDEYEFKDHEVDDAFLKEAEKTTPLEKSLGFEASWKESVNNPLDKLMEANQKLLQKERQEMDAKAKAEEGGFNIDDDGMGDYEQDAEESQPKAFDLQEMEFQYEAVEEVALPGESESEQDSSAEEAEGTK